MPQQVPRGWGLSESEEGYQRPWTALLTLDCHAPHSVATASGLPGDAQALV